MNRDIIDLLAIWELVHESADEGLKAAIRRGDQQEPGDPSKGPGEFVDGLTALVDSRMEEIKQNLRDEMDTQKQLDGEKDGVTRSKRNESNEIAADELNDLRFEVAELRGAIETLTTKIDSLERAYTKAHPPVQKRA